MEIADTVQVCAKSDTGRVRKENEDTYLIVDHKTNDFDFQYYGRMYAIADGMGGHAGGKIASKMVCQGLLEYYHAGKFSEEGTEDIYKTRLHRLKTNVYGLHDRIHKYGEENREYANLGTTLSVLVLFKNKALIAHVGDSRIYRLRGNSMEQLTQDHTMAQTLIDLNYLTPRSAQTHPSQHVLTQAIGHDVEFIHDRIEDVKKGDMFLLCSDGLYNMLNDKVIKAILLNNSMLDEKCKQLVLSALEMGGTDNITLIVAQI